MVSSSTLFMTLVVVSAATASVGAVTQLGSASGSGSSAIPFCNQTQLVELGSILKSNARKLQCQSVLKITEMLKPPNNNFKILCDEVPCTVALTSLYNTLPQCRYQNWSPQDEAGTVLRFCGIVSENTTDPGAGSFTGIATVSPTPVATWSSSSSAGATPFAPVGATTPAPVAATPSPTPAKSIAAVTPLASALVLATSLLAAVVFA